MLYNSMATQQLPPAPSPDIVAPLYDQVAKFHGNQYRFLVVALKHPDQDISWLCEQADISRPTLYRWCNEKPAFNSVLKQIQAQNGELRTAYAKAAFLEATPRVADAMVADAMGFGKDSQRARERILETVGVLPKGGAELPQAPVQVVTHTYVLVQREPGSQGMVVEGQTKELPPRP